MGDGDGDDVHVIDDRWNLLEKITLRNMNLKNDKWGKLASNEDLKPIIQGWLDKAEVTHLVMVLNIAGQIEPSYQFPASTKTKYMYFVKNENVAIPKSPEKFNAVVTVGAMAQLPLEQFSAVIDEIVAPIFTNDGNLESWPEVVTKDFLKHVMKLKADVYEISGSVRGETLLSLPVGHERVIQNPAYALGVTDDGDNKNTPLDRELIQGMQDCIINWTRQIKKIFDQDSSHALNNRNDFPLPNVEIQFWEERYKDLKNIYAQLTNPVVRKLATLLKLIDSTYYSTVYNIFEDVKEELHRSEDIVAHLKPMRNVLDELEQADFVEIIETKYMILRRVLEVIGMVWSHCDSYRDPVRIVVLFKEICNLMIEIARNYLDPENILKGEIDESLEKVNNALKVMTEFSKLFEAMRKDLQRFFEESGKITKEWEFSYDLIFADRYDRVVNRIKDLQNFLMTCNEYLKLEKVEFGGIQGGALSQQVFDIFEEFNNEYRIFTERNYDAMNYLDEKFGYKVDFAADYFRFKNKIRDFDRRLAKCACLGFDDCLNTENMFKLLAIFGSLVQRPLISSDFDANYIRLIKTYNDELDRAKRIYDRQIEETARLGYAPVHAMQPPVAGQLKWARELRVRIQRPRHSFNLVDHPTMQSDSAEAIYRKYDQMESLISKFEENVYAEWVATVDEACNFNMNQPVLKRDAQNNILSVNFDRALTTVLREVRYLKFLEKPDIPESALKLYEQNDKFRDLTANLDRTVAWYNKIRATIIDVEAPILADQLETIDAYLKEAETSLYWSDPKVSEYTTEARNQVQDLETRLTSSKDNVIMIDSIMSNWCKYSLYERKPDQKDPRNKVLDIENKDDKKMKKYNIIKADGERIHKLIAENAEFLKADISGPNWKAYLDFVDDKIIDGLEACLKCSLSYLYENMENKPDQIPLFAAKLELQMPKMVFSPSLEAQNTNSFQNLVASILDDIFQQASLIERVSIQDSSESTDAQTNRNSYVWEMEDSSDLMSLREEIDDKVREASEQAQAHADTFQQFQNLWEDDRNQFLKQFLTYGHILTPEEIESYAGEPIPETPPKIAQFKEQIDSYETLFDSISNFDDTEIFLSWFRVTITPFKAALLNIVKKWSLMFKQHIVTTIENDLAGLDTFIAETNKGLSTKIDEGDYDGLVTLMEHLLQVRDREVLTDNMFGPIKEYIDLLKSYNHENEMKEEVHRQLARLPDQWAGLKKTSTNVKQDVAPLQANEVAVIRRHCTSFDVQQHEFREKFRAELFFRWICEAPYPSIFDSHCLIRDKESEMIDLAEKAALFEVSIPEFKQLKACRKEIVLVKEVWDLASLVKSCIEAWRTTKWDNINVEEMDMDCKRFAKEIRGMDKEVRAWDVFTGLDNTVKNMITSFRVIGELQNSAVRERHWHQLMQTTKVRFTMNDETTLADLLKLNLHNFEEEVRGIVDKAVKEMGMEKTLVEMEAIWSAFNFEHEPHSRTGTALLKSDEELVETLEDNQVQLQALMTSKYIAHFLEEVSGWQKKLSTTDSVMTIWFEVQRTWSHLESIFIGSEDIRTQLREDAERFDVIDREFKQIMEDAKQNINVVACTNKPGLYEHLEKLQNMLTKCEKALAEYLETKRLAFPRFYFVSSSDLLDILSNGTNPEAVCKHLEKLFDNLSDMEFEGKTKNAITMVSQQGEKVPMVEPCDCDGQVEYWLNRVLNNMVETIRFQLGDSISSYEDKPRDQWLFDFPAQCALAATQIWWTTDVTMAFGRLEEGYENAMKDYNKKQVQQLNALINLLLSDLTSGDRQKIMTICTIDVHSRDVVGKLITQKTDNANAFLWQSQLRHRWSEKDNHCYANICDACFLYSYEYLGNTPRLVITPLTDRCYITLTQSLHLIMGGAPAGPAGTGKTETTKDLGRALGVMVYVFNCSEQMDYKSCGNIYKGLAQTGAWGCFDEFNRISVEVLSVVAVQVKTIQSAIKTKKTRFIFEGEDISLIDKVGLFITMNPGYAGRTELPENLKALFRPCAMCVPDFAMIAEIMLVAEGFQEATILSKKFITLYTLCKELLSKQDHYDWGLRAIKSVLVVAGQLKRSDRGRPEDQVLMRALRDFNIPKIITEDMSVFMGLINDLFPGLDVPRKCDVTFEGQCKQAVLDLKFQAEENFVLKLVQLDELLFVRHSVFVIGNAGAGKSAVLKSLNKTYANQKKRPFWVDLNPKVVTNDDLFGVINPATREWRDGLFSTIMRDTANMSGDGPRWIVLDGDIDPMWIESLNTVMDDNKVLTLASNERIPLKSTMRLLFEIAHLRTATPATVSRAGILFINPADLGWQPVVTSWIDTREIQSEKANLTILFEKYIPATIEAIKKYKTITPIPDVNPIHTLCNFLEVLLTPENTPADCPKEWYEYFFVFACIWAFGGSLYQDQVCDYRVEFSKWWVNEFKTIKFPSQGTVFDYFLEPNSKKFCPWTDLSQNCTFELDPDIPLQSTIVATSETVRYKYFLDMLMDHGKPVMLIGNAGSGKTVMIQDKLKSLDEDFMVANVPFNFYTTSLMLQGVLEKPLEKKAGRNYGPPGNKRLVYFVDDMNMPEVDNYGTVQPHTLLRQYMDYHHWYDRAKLTIKDISNVQFVSCMNPTAGSFTINPRLQRHFATFAVSFPSNEALKTIYSSILQGHLDHGKFNTNIQKLCNQAADACLTLHQRVAQTFLPTAIKFHYSFTLRDLSNVFQGVMFSNGAVVKTQNDFVRMLIHECSRVYGDKMIEKKDIDTFNALNLEVFTKIFEELPSGDLSAEPNLFCHFALGIGEPKYAPVASWQKINEVLVEALEAYNEVNAAMDLVLFEDAMSNVLRINRILESPRGNALLVGVGGSGKQSLSRLAASISGLEVFQITLRKGYSIPDLKLDIGQLYMKAGVKNVGTMFLMTDAQVADEKFLVLINDLLASGEIPELFVDDEIEEIIAGVRNEVKGTGQEDTRENCWNFFIDRVRRMLKVVLCFSPVGTTLRVRARKFPALVNCTQIDWFHDWPLDALQSVALRFVSNMDDVPDHLKKGIADSMAFVHGSVNNSSDEYLTNERRYNYTTPKSFLEQIKLYNNLLSKKTKDLRASMERLENGLEKLRSCSAVVDDLKLKLAAQEIELKQKNADADQLIEIVGVETAKVSKEKEFADTEERKVAVIAKDVGAKQISCETDLAKAEPALKAAEAALNTLNKPNLTELKSFGSPANAIVSVTAAVMCLLSKDKVPKDRSWKACKGMMAKVDQFLLDLINYDKENIPEHCLKAVQPYLDDEEFDPDFIAKKSSAAAGLCSWVVNIVSFYRVFCDVEPKRIALAEANATLAAAETKLSGIQAKIAELDASLKELTDKFETATNAKLKCQQEAEATALTINLANRLVGGLASENVRWGIEVGKMKEMEKLLPGDCLLLTGFISYIGYFTKAYRGKLEGQWRTFLGSQETVIPTTEGLDVISLVTDDATVAGWNNEGLPSDRMSSENATILSTCERWPLMVDPQFQGIKWIKKKYGESLRIVRIGAKGYLDAVERAVSNGDVVLIENMGEYVDPVLDPILGRNTIKKGKFIKIGDKEVDYHPDFKLILHTKLSNPHYQPEMQAQCTLINFSVTRDGLEDQLLAEVVRAERPDLEELKAKLTMQQNEFKITLKSLEDALLARLSAAGGNFLGDTALVENLEVTKKTATEIEIQVAEAQITEKNINEAREHYRPAAARASLLYFILNDLNKVNPMYQFSLKAFVVVFHTAIENAEKAEAGNVHKRVTNLIDCMTWTVTQYVSRGLFTRDKLLLTAQIAFQVLTHANKINPVELDFLLRFPSKADQGSPVDFLTNIGWGAIRSLSDMEEFKGLDRDIEGSAKRWKKFVESECPEKEKFPQEWKNKDSLQRLCMMRAMRPDRMTYALRTFIEEKMGSMYVEDRAVPFSKSFEESSPSTPIFFILSPGVDPLKDVEAQGKLLGFTFDKQNFHNVSLGQGQEVVAESKLDTGYKMGHWVILQNIHLVRSWLPSLEKLMETYALGANPDFRIFMSAEPSGDPAAHFIPQGILENAIKITNEPPTGINANLHKALDNFSQETLESCSRENEFKSILQSLCYFHAVVCERRKFGPQGWNRPYPFNVGDLTICVNVLQNYLEANAKVPFDDLRYLFGDIMYGGHITDDWDRILCKTYLEEYMHPDQLETDFYLAPNYLIPPDADYQGYHNYINENLPAESPVLYGLHPNAEIGVLTTTSENLFKTLLELQPKDTSAGSGEGMSRDDQIKAILDDILEKLPEDFNPAELRSRAIESDTLTPYAVVAIQEAERMMFLTFEMRRSLKELTLGLKGELTISPPMEALMNSFMLDFVPDNWTKRAYPSNLGLSAWFADLLLRIKDLEAWTGDFNLPNTVWLGGLFNPQSFLTAVMQQMSRKNEWPLDKMVLQCDVTKKNKEDFNTPPREGAYIHGLFMEGARWDAQAGTVAESKLKELTPQMPVVLIKAIPSDRRETKNVYQCPVYKTKDRGPTYVWDFYLKTKDKPSKWILGGVAVLLQD